MDLDNIEYYTLSDILFMQKEYFSGLTEDPEDKDYKLDVKYPQIKFKK